MNPVALLLLLLGFSAAQALADENAASRRIALYGHESARGIFDPSVAHDPQNGRFWMSYSSFEASAHSRWGVSLRLAFSDDGERWHDAGEVQSFSDVTVGPLQATEAGEMEVPESSRGTWQNETSALVYDTHAPPEQRWKLFWHQTLWANDVPRHAGYSWIALKMAASPEELVAAPAVKLFTGYLAKSAGESSSPPAMAPIAGPPTIELDKRDPQLGACVFGQPAALSAKEGLYLALDCAWLGTRPLLHTVLLRCAQPACNVTDAASWAVVGRLTEPRDGLLIDERYRGFGGTALAEANGRYYLIASPVTQADDRYDGCYVFRFKDLARAELQRERRGRLNIARIVSGIPNTHHGACAAHADLKGGILLSQIMSTAAPRVMQIRQSGVALP
jgi:hypothetical protein